SKLPNQTSLEDDHSPAISSPLNREVKATLQKVQNLISDETQSAVSREKRTKKDSLKKRESKSTVGGDGGSRPALTNRPVYPALRACASPRRLRRSA
ncbi:hypothetical protein B0T17DRAFT_535245, partial [Bombardia bombarda]